MIWYKLEPNYLNKAAYFNHRDRHLSTRAITITSVDSKPTAWWRPASTGRWNSKEFTGSIDDAFDFVETLP